MSKCTKLYFLMLFLCTLFSVVSGCGTNEYEDEHKIGEEFSLHIGETVSLNGEDLRIQFLEISEDSRCPRKVTCVWEGRAIAIIEVLKGNTSQELELVDQGITDTSANKQYEEYEFLFRIVPYPAKAEVQISRDEYRLMLTVNKE